MAGEVRRQSGYDMAGSVFLSGYGDADEMRALRQAQLYVARCNMRGYRQWGDPVASYASWKMRPLVSI